MIILSPLHRWLQTTHRSIAEPQTGRVGPPIFFRPLLEPLPPSLPSFCFQVHNPYGGKENGIGYRTPSFPPRGSLSFSPPPLKPYLNPPPSRPIPLHAISFPRTSRHAIATSHFLLHLFSHDYQSRIENARASELGDYLVRGFFPSSVIPSHSLWSSISQKVPTQLQPVSLFLLPLSFSPLSLFLHSLHPHERLGNT
jgi:hypothetical protein